MRTALVVSGGGLDGFCVGAGLLQALCDSGRLHGDLETFGTSAGSAIACWAAAGLPGSGLTALLRSLTDADIRDPRPLARLRLGWIDHAWEGRRLRDTLAREMPGWRAMRHPWHAYAVPRTRAAPVDVACQAAGSSPAECCLASMAIPAVFPPVRLSDGVEYQDGGLAFNVPLPADLNAYDRVYVAVLSGGIRAYSPRRSALTEAIGCLQRAMAGQTAVAVQRAMAHRNVTVLWPQLDGRGGMLHLDHDLIGRAYEAGRATLVNA